jgi:hypothetical protein
MFMADEKKEEVRIEAWFWDEEDEPFEQPIQPVQAVQSQMPNEAPQKEDVSIYHAFIPDKHQPAYCKWWSKENIFEIYPGRCERMGCDIFIIEMASSSVKEPRKKRESFPYCCEHCTTNIHEAGKVVEKYKESEQSGEFPIKSGSVEGYSENKKSDLIFKRRY